MSDDRREETAKDEAEAEPVGATDTHPEAEPLPEPIAEAAERADEAVAHEIGRRTRRSFVVGGVATAAAYVGWQWLRGLPSTEGGLPVPFRRAHELNERLSQAYFNPDRRAPEFPRSMAQDLRVNGGEGLPNGFNADTWRLQIVGLADPKQYSQYRDDIAYETAMGEPNQQQAPPDLKSAPGEELPAGAVDQPAAMDMKEPGLLLTLEDIRALPRTEMVAEFKCIEGWSSIVHWAGARFADFAAAYRPPDHILYAGFVTPDGGYYVGMDMATLMHPQTLLCYEMNGAPLTFEHGRPLRLITPFKYGIKQIKRIGRITFTQDRPADFWGERGYDWYAGH